MSNEIAVYMQRETVRERFSELMGNRNAAAYISSVMLAVANQDTLQKCSPESIYISALRAATLHLSVDPSLGQAYLVAFKNKATLIPGYKGLYDMAVRTGKYRYINVGHLYQGETFEIDRISGFGSFGGGKTGDKIIGYFGAFEMVGGYAKTIYMSVDEIEQHALKYSRNYNFEDSLWKKEHDKMCRKTVLRILIRKWGYIDPQDASMLEEIEADNSEIIDGEEIESVPSIPTPNNNGSKPNAPEPVPAEMSLEMAKNVMGSDGKKYGECTEKELEGKMMGITRKLNIKNLDPDEREELLYKLDAINVLLKDIIANKATQAG